MFAKPLIEFSGKAPSDMKRAAVPATLGLAGIGYATKDLTNPGDLLSVG